MANGPSRKWWIETTGVAPGPGVPFPAESFPRYARAGARAQWNAQAKETAPARPDWEAYYTTRKDYLAARREARAWSKEHSQQAMSKWSDKFTARETHAYYTAYVSDPWRYFGHTGRRKGSPWHKFYAVDIGGFMTSEEYDAMYPVAA